MVRKLEKRLEFANRDPHGRPIPSQADIQAGGPGHRAVEQPVGFGSPIHDSEMPR